MSALTDDARVEASRMREDVSAEILRLNKAYPTRLVILVMANSVDQSTLVMPAANCPSKVSVAMMRIAAHHMMIADYQELPPHDPSMENA